MIGCARAPRSLHPPSAHQPRAHELGRCRRCVIPAQARTLQEVAYIESIREILEFSDVEDEIRTMCEQSSIPKSLVDVAVSDPDKLDELEEAAEG